MSIIGLQSFPSTTKQSLINLSIHFTHISIFYLPFMFVYLL